MIIDLGSIDYEDAYKVQKELAWRRRLGEIDDSVVLAEHNHIFTIGRTGRMENLLVDENELERSGAKVIRVDRGGDITYHGPGQLVVYPVIDLRRRSRDLHKYLRDLEEVAINFLREYSINAARISGKTGVWTGDKKIVSIGVGSSGWVTYHGMSININTDLSFFSMINPCGMKDVEMTSLYDLIGRYIDMNEAKEKMAACLYNMFKITDKTLEVAFTGNCGTATKFVYTNLVPTVWLLPCGQPPRLRQVRHDRYIYPKEAACCG